MRIASRLSGARGSATARIARITAEREARGEQILKLNIGEPNYDTPEFIADAARRALRNGQTRYTDVAGTPELRRAAAEKFQMENGIRCTAQQIIIGTGAKQLIFNAVMATVTDGDEVVIPTPSWVSYPDMTVIAGGRPVIVACGGATDFKMTAAQLAEALSSRTRWVILNSPCNPTGAVYSAGELRKLAEALRAFPHAAVMCDDIYEKIIFDGLEFATMAGVAPDLGNRILTVNGVSKSHAMTGWRIGYAVGPQDLINAMITLQSQSTTNASSVSQAAALAALAEQRQSAEFLTRCRSEYERSRNLILQKLMKIRELQYVRPQGAFYVFVSCRRLLGRTTPDGKPVRDDTDFCAYLLSHAGVSAVPGAAFGAEGYFRLSFAVGPDTLEEACERIGDAVSALR